MTNEQKESTNQIKHYQIILLSCFFGCILMLNSNYINKKRDLIKLDKEREVLFNNLIQQRQLSEDTSSSTDEICSRASKDLNEYYETADLSKIDLDEGPIKAEDKDEGYMKALIKIVRSFADEGDEEEDDEGEDDSDSDSSSSKISKENLIEYGKRILPMLVFLIIGILSIIGWIICCFCTCCNCCCCCCCKKPSCKIPCFIFTYVFFALVVAVCIYGLSQANKIFVGLADTECSALKFFDQVLYGETKQTLPRWGGIRIINQILNDLSSTLGSLTGSTYTQLGTHYGNIDSQRTSFDTKMQGIGAEFWDGTTYKSPYVKTYTGTTDYPRNGLYIYDTVKMFGRWDGTRYTEDSFLDMWNREYSRISQEAYDNLGRAQNSFTDLLDENIGPIQEALADGVDGLNELTEPFENAKEQIADILSGTSEKIDKYGKMGVKIVFGVLMIINVALAALLLLICLFSGQACTSCCCCRCIFKLCTHVLWNVLALMMILSFIVGALLSLVGRIGGDAMTLISFIVSEVNFNDEENPLLLNKLGDAKKYLKRCIQEDGDIAQELNLGDSLNSFNQINNVEENILIQS